MACGFQTRLTGSKTDFKEKHNKSIYNLFCKLFEYISDPLPDSIIPASVYWKTIDFEKTTSVESRAHHQESILPARATTIPRSGNSPRTFVIWGGFVTQSGSPWNGNCTYEAINIIQTQYTWWYRWCFSPQIHKVCWRVCRCSSPSHKLSSRTPRKSRQLKRLRMVSLGVRRQA